MLPTCTESTQHDTAFDCSLSRPPRSEAKEALLHRRSHPGLEEGLQAAHEREAAGPSHPPIGERCRLRTVYQVPNEQNRESNGDSARDALPYRPLRIAESKRQPGGDRPPRPDPGDFCRNECIDGIRVETGDRLVEDQYVRPSGECAHDRKPLLLSRREHADRRMQRHFPSAGKFSRIAPVEPRIEGGDVAEHGLAAQPWKLARRLRHISDPFACIGRKRRRRFAKKFAVPTIDGNRPRMHFSSVVLPAPLAPSSPTADPRCTASPACRAQTGGHKPLSAPAH